MPALLRFDGSLPRHPAVQRWFDERPSELGSLASAWFERMRQCGPDVRELVHDRCPVACVQDAPFGYVNVFRAHVNVGFFHGDALADPAGLLEGSGRFMRHLKLHIGRAQGQAPGQAPTHTPEPGHEAALAALITGAYADIRRRLRQA
jgi:hypothetical protein